MFLKKGKKKEPRKMRFSSRVEMKKIHRRFCHGELPKTRVVDAHSCMLTGSLERKRRKLKRNCT